MKALRSSYVHHLGTEPFGLDNFAEATDREDELVPTVDDPPRPTLGLFLDYVDHVIDSRELDSLHHQVTVESIRENSCGSGFRLETARHSRAVRVDRSGYQASRRSDHENHRTTGASA